MLFASYLQAPSYHLACPKSILPSWYQPGYVVLSVPLELGTTIVLVRKYLRVRLREQNPDYLVECQQEPENDGDHDAETVG